MRLREVFDISSAFVLPMLTQTHVFEYPLTILESLWYSVPPLCSDFESFRELIVDEENGLLTKAGSVEDLESALRRLVTEGSFYEKIKSKTRQSLGKIYPNSLRDDVLNFLIKK